MHRYLLFIWILMQPLMLTAQQHLCERDAVGYGICFTLKNDGTFFYEFNHCTGTQFGQGRYERHHRQLRFQFDSVPSQSIHYITSSGGSSTIKIYYRDYFSHEPFAYAELIYAGKKYLTDTSGNVTIPWHGGIIVVKKIMGRDSLVLDPGDRGVTQIHLDWILGGSSFVKAGTSMRFRRKGQQWIRREAFMDNDEEKMRSRKRYRQLVYVFRDE